MNHFQKVADEGIKCVLFLREEPKYKKDSKLQKSPNFLRGNFPVSQITGINRGFIISPSFIEEDDFECFAHDPRRCKTFFYVYISSAHMNIFPQ